MKVFGNTLGGPRHRVRLEWAYQQTSTLLPDVEGFVGVPENRQVWPMIPDLGDRLGDQIVMLDGDDG